MATKLAPQGNVVPNMSRRNINTDSFFQQVDDDPFYLVSPAAVYCDRCQSNRDCGGHEENAEQGLIGSLAKDTESIDADLATKVFGASLRNSLAY